MSVPPAGLFDPRIVPSPCYVIDLGRLADNARILDDVQRETGARILLALKAFSAFGVFSCLSRAFSGPLWGTCASSVDEARLGREEFGGETHAFAAAWSKAEFEELLRYADHVSFNSIGQMRAFRPMIEMANRGFRKASPVDYGLRVNPEHSEGATPIYDPCAPGSRLGIRAREMENALAGDLDGISGLHFHTLCEQDAAPLKRTLEVFEQKFGKYAHGLKWLNFGGGHHITRPGYDLAMLKGLLLDWRERYGCRIYLEPGEAVALNAGWLTATVLDIAQADMPVAILDASAACHMPDVLEMPYTPDVWQKTGSGPRLAAPPGNGGNIARLAGKSCLAGDVIGEYAFDEPLRIGDRLVFADMAIYSMVKNNTFNGLRLPSIGVWEGGDAPFRLLREFGYEDFRMRLS